jgi:LysR family nitrogen assimilation transcriptional regulator
VSHPRRPLSAAADALISIIADELRQVSSASDMNVPLPHERISTVRRPSS